MGADEEVLDVHDHVKKRVLSMQSHAWSGQIIGAKAHDIFDFACYPNIGAARIVTDDKTSFVHGGTGHFAMQRMIILRRRAAVAQHAAMECKTPICLDD